ncbi:MAG: pyridoxal phosphate-dependent aminotransferase, partial [Vulcanimicrobiaceae bacterium]
QSQNVILGHGSNEIVNIVAHALLDPGDEAIMATPTFSLYSLAVKSVDAHPIEIPLRDGVHDIEAMLAAITPKTRLFIVCDPNNPTGTRLDSTAWERIFTTLPEDITLIVDQAYLEYADATAIDAARNVARRSNMLVLRTMSKIYGLAALRFGYAFGSPEIIATLEKIRLPFNVSALAAAGAMAALADTDFVARSRTLNENEKVEVAAAYARLRLHAYPTHANFFAVEIPMPANVAYEALLRRGIIVRSGDGLRMPGRLRITIGTAEQNAALITALEALLA